MELKAVIAGLNFVNQLSQEGIDQVFVYTDSSYVLRGATQWLFGWEAKNWITATKTEVLNKDLWQDMATVLRALQAKGIKIIWKLLSGHVGIPGNERCDEIATQFADSAAPALFLGSFADYSIKNILDISPNAEAKEKRSGSKERSRAKAYSYVSKVGGVIQVHKTWAECEARVKGVKGVGTFFKKSLDAADEKAIIAEFESK
jgi:ribonuclease HI